MRFCVRIHPHVAKKSRADRAQWTNLDLPGVLVIGPDDATDSYALIDRSRIVCTYGSTVGIEATYWNRPSLLFSASYFDQLGVCEIATSAEQIREFLRNPVVFPRDRTLPYGAFWTMLGEPYRYYQANGLHRGSICGVYLDDSLAVRLARKLLRLVSRLFGAAG
jgi:CDP-glycerol glycerophosphotransferase (TagB/SpsB family)